jgi:hypothetical protein
MTSRQLARLHEHLAKLKLVTIQAPLEILLSGWSCDSGPGRKAGGVPAPIFPAPGWARRTLPAVYVEVAQWLRHQAVQWWVITDRSIELC